MRNAFPVAFPDELLASVMARFRHEYPSFFEKDIPSHLRRRGAQYNRWAYELKQVEVIWPRILSIYPIKTIPQFAEEHTLYLLFKPFWAADIWEKLHQEYDFWNYQTSKLREIPIDCLNIDDSITYKFCPTCATEDWWNHGAAYWHRIHNIWGVSVCPHHKVRLIDTQFRINEAEKLLPAEEFIKDEEFPVQPLSDDSEQDQLDLYIVEAMSWLLNHAGPLEPGRVAEQYDLLYASYGIDRFLDGHLVEWVWKNCLPNQEIRLCLPDTIDKDSPFYFSSTAYFFPRPTTHTPHPTIHIINWLAWGFTPEEFLNFDGDWSQRTLKLTRPRPCQNKACTHYGQNLITHTTIEKQEISSQQPHQKLGINVYDEYGFFYTLTCPICQSNYTQEIESAQHYEPNRTP